MVGRPNVQSRPRRLCLAVRGKYDVQPCLADIPDHDRYWAECDDLDFHLAR